MDEENVYICDPKKNKECRKTACQTECFLTHKKEYSIRQITLGHWIITRCYARTDNGMLLHGLSCSNCGKITYITSSMKTPRGCPFCLAVMRESEE